MRYISSVRWFFIKQYMELLILFGEIWNFFLLLNFTFQLILSFDVTLHSNINQMCSWNKVIQLIKTIRIEKALNELRKKKVKLSSCQDMTLFNDEKCSLNTVHNAMKKLIHILQQFTFFSRKNDNKYCIFRSLPNKTH